MNDDDPGLQIGESGLLEAVWGGTVSRCRVPPEGIPMGHLGCRHIRKTIDRLSDLPERLEDELDEKYGPSWRRPGDAVGCVVSALEFAAGAARLGGALLIDTMRGGSDYWRPGKLLTDVAACLREGGLDVSYAREDALCPGTELLNRFRREKSLGFSAYAAAYEQELLTDDSKALRVGAFLTVSALSRNLLPVFYCTDPYIPGYAPALKKDETPFAGRRYAEDPEGYLRERGCHRIVLVECLARFLSPLGIPVTIHELDANAGTSYRRRW